MAELQQSPKKARTEPAFPEGEGGDFIELEPGEGEGGEAGPTEAENEAYVALEQELRAVQAELDKETEEMLEKIRGIEAEYERRKQPLYKARGRVIRQIPGFWPLCFQKHEGIGLLLGETDREILKSLTELEVEPFEEAGSGWELVLRFGENEWFADAELRKQVRTLQEEGAPLQYQLSACRPAWRGQDPTAEEVEREGRKRGRDSAAFFRWLGEEGTIDAGLESELADVIREQLWVNPLQIIDAEGDDDAVTPRPSIGASKPASPALLQLAASLQASRPAQPIPTAQR